MYEGVLSKMTSQMYTNEISNKCLYTIIVVHSSMHTIIVHSSMQKKKKIIIIMLAR